MLVVCFLSTFNRNNRINSLVCRFFFFFFSFSFNSFFIGFFFDLFGIYLHFCWILLPVAIGRYIFIQFGPSYSLVCSNEWGNRSIFTCKILCHLKSSIIVKIGFLHTIFNHQSHQRAHNETYTQKKTVALHSTEYGMVKLAVKQSHKIYGDLNEIWTFSIASSIWCANLCMWDLILLCVDARLCSSLCI